MGTTMPQAQRALKRGCTGPIEAHKERARQSRGLDSTYLSCNEASPTSAVEQPGRTAAVVVATSGNCCLKLARRSSPGFCELLLDGHERG